MKGWPGEPEMDYDVMVADDAAADAAGKPIENVIFDFGNVLIYWEPAAVLVPRYSERTVERFLDNDGLRLLLRSDEQDLSALLRDLLHSGISDIQLLQRLLQVDDVDVVAAGVDVRFHLRVPATCLVTEMNAGLQQLSH